jgi:hypothetical protein
MVMTFLLLGWLIYINLWHSSTHIRDDPTMPKNRHGSSWWNHCHREMLWGRKKLPEPTPASNWRTGQDIYIYNHCIIYIIILYIHTYVYCIYVYDIYRGYLEPKEASLSVESKNPQWRRTGLRLRTWSKRPSRCGPSGNSNLKTGQNCQ